VQDREELPDDVPVADAVEQQRTPVESALVCRDLCRTSRRRPLEAAPADWQE
jgi:hypothetical protein